MSPDFTDRPIAFVPRLTAPAIREADIVWGCTPDGCRALLRADVGGRTLGYAEALRRVGAADVKVLEVPCHDEDDVVVLRSLVRAVRGD